jgi:hypothetical protein
VAGGWHGLERVPVPDHPLELIEAGKSKQREAIGRNLVTLSELPDIGKAGILVGRGRRAPSIAKAITAHPQIHIAEGHAVCDAITSVLEDHRISVSHIDRKTLFDQAEQRLHLAKKNVLARLKTQIPESGSWRQEEKPSAIAAWLSS